MYKTRQDKEYKNSYKESYINKKDIGRRDFLGYVGRSLAALGIMAGASFISPLEAMADTVYYGTVKNASNPAYVVYDDVKEKSKYQPKKNDTNYDKDVSTRTENIKSAITNVAKNNSYDVVVKKDDPKIDNYKDITSDVIKELESIEK